MVEGICNLLRISTSIVESTPLRPGHSKDPTPHAADSIAGRSLALPVHLSTTSPPTPALHTRACLTTVFQPMTPLPYYAQLNKLRRHFAPRSHGSRFKSISSPHFTECTCPVTLGLSNFRSFVPAIPSQKFESGVDDTANGLSSTSQRVVADATSAAEFIIHSFNQHRRRDLF